MGVLYHKMDSPTFLKMVKTKIYERAMKIAEDRLASEIVFKKDTMPGWYLQGYHEAICDFIWDFVGSTVVCKEWEAYIEVQIKRGKVKIGSIPIKNIKINSGS